jgi:hypothetical protein
MIALGREPGGGLVVMPDLFTVVHRATLISAAARNNVPAVYWQSSFARDGGLLSYGVYPAEAYRLAATYVDRILRGAKPAELPVQFVTKFEMAVNLKTAKAHFAACRRGHRIEISQRKTIDWTADSSSGSSRAAPRCPQPWQLFPEAAMRQHGSASPRGLADASIAGRLRRFSRC